MELKTTSFEELFQVGLGLDWRSMKIGEAVDVSAKGVVIDSFSHEKEKRTPSRVLRAIRKPDAVGYAVMMENLRLFSCSKDHKLWVKLHLDMEASYLKVEQLLGKTFYLFDGSFWKAAGVRKSNKKIPILDVEVEDTHNYFSGGVLSHNTVYGNPECVTPDTLITRGSIETQETMEKLFSLCGVNWRVMSPGDSIDVSSKGILVSSFNEAKKVVEEKKVLKLIRKADSPVFSVQTTAGVELFKASLAHKIFASTDGGKTFNWSDLLSLKGNNDIIVKSMDSEKVYEQDIQIQGYGAVYPILDFEVEGNHNYFANGVLSHNTTTGGNALRFYASVRLTTRRKEYVGAADAPEGIVTVVKAIKNKVATPFRSCEVKLLFGKGYQVEEEFISAFVERELIQKGGSWYTILYADKDGKELSERVQGLEKVIDFFKSNPEVFEVYKQKIHALIEKETSVATLDQDKEEDKDAIDKQQERLEKEALDV